jgi:hypothetical protein
MNEPSGRNDRRQRDGLWTLASAVPTRSVGEHEPAWAPEGQPDDVESDANVDALLFTGTQEVGGAVGEPHGPRVKAKRPTVHLNALSTDRAELRLPELMPGQTVRPARNAGVEPCLYESPRAVVAQSAGECLNVVVRIPIPESRTSGMEEILFVNEDHCAFDCRLERAQRGLGRKK